MIATIIALLAIAGSSTPGCLSFVDEPAAAQRTETAAVVSRAAHARVPTSAIDAVLRSREWQVVWARPDGAEPGVFLLHRIGGALHYVDVWGGPTSDMAGASRWARHAGVPAPLAQCFARRLVTHGP